MQCEVMARKSEAPWASKSYPRGNGARRQENKGAQSRKLTAASDPQGLDGEAESLAISHRIALLGIVVGYLADLTASPRYRVTASSVRSGSLEMASPRVAASRFRPAEKPLVDADLIA